MNPAIKKFASEPFEYGVMDCCTFVGKCLEADGKANPMPHYKYHGEQGALSAINLHSTLTRSITAWLGEPVAEPRPGDVAVVMNHGREIAGYVIETGLGLRIVIKTPKTVTDLSIERGVTFWRPNDG